MWQVNLASLVESPDSTVEHQTEGALFFFTYKKIIYFEQFGSLFLHLFPCIPLQKSFRCTPTCEERDVFRVSGSCTSITAGDLKEPKCLTLGAGYIP